MLLQVFVAPSPGIVSSFADFFSPNSFSYSGSFFKSRGERSRYFSVCCVGGGVVEGVTEGVGWGVNVDVARGI